MNAVGKLSATELVTNEGEKVVSTHAHTVDELLKKKQNYQSMTKTIETPYYFGFSYELVGKLSEISEFKKLSQFLQISVMVL